MPLQLLTGTPLQNNLVSAEPSLAFLDGRATDTALPLARLQQELWSLLYFLMPNEAELDGTAFVNHKMFNEWFSSASAVCRKR